MIRAYDRAVKSWRKSKVSGDAGPGGSDTPSIGPWIAIKRDEDKDNLLAVGSWVLGSPCRAIWNQDGLEYEAKIVAIEGPRCTIRFVGK